MGDSDMKICIDGITRDMTPEEEAEYLTEPDPDPEEALSILLGGVEA